jgi:hypothetical protein
MNKVKHTKSWLIHLATSTQWKVVELVKECIVTMDGMEAKVDLNVLPLESYDLIIGMDWLEKHVNVVNCENKTFDCLVELGQGKTIKGYLVVCW